MVRITRPVAWRVWRAHSLAAAREACVVDRRFRLHFLLPAVVVSTFVLASCTTTLEHIRHDNAARVLRQYRSQPVAAANMGRNVLTLHDCTRIALQNSLDLQAARWDEQVKTSLVRSSRVRMLPTVWARFGETQRDRPSFSRSDVYGQEGAYEVYGPGPGTGVTNWSTGQEHNLRRSEVELRWSPMDAAIAGYLARVKCNEASHSAYQRVRVAQQLIGNVSSAFYRLLTLIRAQPRAMELCNHRAAIVRDLQDLAGRGLADPQELITAKSMLAEAQRRLADINVNIGKQREILAAAMGVSPDSCYGLSGNLVPLPPVCLEPAKLEAAALVNRPEAYQADLTHLNSMSERKRLIVKFFPRAEGYLGYYRDENKYLMNKNWTDGGLRLTWDLMDGIATLLESRAATEKVTQTDRERAAISLAILSQVRMRTLDAANAFEEFKKASKLRDQAWEKHRIAKDVEDTVEQKAPEHMIRIVREKALCEYLQAELDRLYALGEVHAALATLDVAVGSAYPVSQAHPVPGPNPAAKLAMKPIVALKKAGHFLGKLIPY